MVMIALSNVKLHNMRASVLSALYVKPLENVRQTREKNMVMAASSWQQQNQM